MRSKFVSSGESPACTQKILLSIVAAKGMQLKTCGGAGLFSGYNKLKFSICLILITRIQITGINWTQRGQEPEWEFYQKRVRNWTSHEENADVAKRLPHLHVEAPLHLNSKTRVDISRLYHSNTSYALKSSIQIYENIDTKSCQDFI